VQYECKPLSSRRQILENYKQRKTDRVGQPRFLLRVNPFVANVEGPADGGS
jgi:hypothetical protein